MTFLNPAGLWLFALALPIVALYFLRLRRRRVVVSSTLLWQAALERSPRRSLLQRLRNPLSLLLQLLILAALTLALARADFGAAERGALTTIVLLDTSIRSKARVEAGSEQTRLEAAVRNVETLVRRAHASNQIALVAFDNVPRVLAPIGPDERTLLDGLRAARSTDAAPDLERAFTLAVQMLQTRSGARRVLLASDLPPPPQADVEVLWQPSGTPAGNAAIRAFSIRPQPADPSAGHVFCEILNTSKDPLEGEVQLELDGRLLDVRPVRAPAGEAVRISFDEIDLAAPRLANRGWAVARLTTVTPDILPADNVALAIAPPTRLRRVLLVSVGNWFLENLLAADRRTEFEMLNPDAYRHTSTAGFDVVVYDGVLPASSPLERVGNAGLLFFGVDPFPPDEQDKAADSDAPAGPTAAIKFPIPQVEAPGHPLVRGVDPALLRILRARVLVPPPDASWRFETVVGATDGPLLLAGARGNAHNTEAQRAVVVAFGVADSDLPLRVAFPLLIDNAFQWLARETPEFRQPTPPGNTIALAPGEWIWNRPHAADLPPSGDPPEREIIRGAFRPVDQGFHLLNRRGKAEWIAVSGASLAGADFRFSTGAGGQTGDSAREPGHGGSVAETLLTGAAPRLVWPPWVWLGLGVALLLGFEWWTFHTRRTE